MAVLQAWPGRGYWQGMLGAQGASGPLTAMVRQMSTTSQPTVISRLLASFASFDAAHGFAVNLFVVVALAVIGIGLCSGRPAVLRWVVPAALVLCLADWVVVEDLGFLGGVGTDPNSMVPMAVLLVAGYLAVAKGAGRREGARSQAGGAPQARIGWRARWASSPTYRAMRSLARHRRRRDHEILGAAPMVAATMETEVADPILYDAIDGTPGLSDRRRPAVPARRPARCHQSAWPTCAARSSRSTFLDPVCRPTDCPLIAQDFKQADLMLGASCPPEPSS